MLEKPKPTVAQHIVCADPLIPVTESFRDMFITRHTKADYSIVSLERSSS